MPLLLVCPKCKKQLKIADTAAGKQIKCPGCTAVFLASKPVSAPAKPKAVAPPPVVKPATASATAENGSVETPAASPSHKAIPKKKSNALLYGCLTGVFVVVLLIGLGVAGVFWLINKGKNALQDWAATATMRKTTDIPSKPPEKVKQSGGDEAKKPGNQPGTNQQPRVEKPPKKELSSQEKLIGRWKGTEVSTNPKEGEVPDRLVFEFQKDGQLHITAGGQKQPPFTYQAEGSKLTVTQTEPGSKKQSVVISIEKLTDKEFVYKTPFGRAGKLTKDNTPPPDPLTEQKDADFSDTFPPKMVYATPQAVFAAAFEAELKGDHETYIRCHAPRLQYRLAQEMALKGLDKSINQANRKGKEAEFWKQHDQPIYDAMAKHGLTAEVLKATTYGDTDDRAERTGRALLSHVKDIGGFLVDYLTADDKAAGRRYLGKKEDLPRLVDLKIAGDKAKGELVIKDFNRERKVPIEFLKVGDGWRLVPLPH